MSMTKAQQKAMIALVFEARTMRVLLDLCQCPLDSRQYAAIANAIEEAVRALPKEAQRELADDGLLADELDNRERLARRRTTSRATGVARPEHVARTWGRRR